MATTTPRKRQPRKVQPRLAPVDTSLIPARREVPVGPVEVGASRRPLVPVFTANNQTYSIPDQINPLVSNRYMEKMKAEGPIAASVWLLRRLFGDEIMDDLEQDPFVSPEDVKALSDKVGSIIFPDAPDEAATGTGN